MKIMKPIFYISFFSILVFGCSSIPNQNKVSRNYASNAIPVWIDTDPSAGEKDRDVDDGLALVQAFNSPELEIKGISVVFGNADLAKGLPIADFIVRNFGPSTLIEKIFSGAASSEDLGKETSASKALAEALAQERMSILALGPATNIATVIRNHPEVVKNIEQVIAVAGRRPGQRFTTGTKNKKGHRDFNFELDPEAFQVLLKSGVPLVLTPFEISSKVWIYEDDIKKFEIGSAATKWLAGPSRDWLGLWKRVFFVEGFNPFDTLAITYLTVPSLLQCEVLPAEIRVLKDDATEYYMQGKKVDKKPYLLADKKIKSSSKVNYCFNANPGFKEDLFKRLLQ